MEQKIKSFNVILHDFNECKFVPYDVIPYFIRIYNSIKSNRPCSFKECKEFILKEAKYEFWGRCEYEIILESWPIDRTKEKWDIYKQILLNIDLVTQVFMNNIKKK